jgi:hypothetical protein
MSTLLQPKKDKVHVDKALELAQKSTASMGTRWLSLSSSHLLSPIGSSLLLPA